MAIFSALLGLWLAAQQNTPEKLPQAVAPQPIPFSHRTHAAQAALACADCHATARTAARAGLPATGKCMACHRTIQAESAGIKKLAEAHQREEKVAWVRVYRVKDFVFFSHAEHAKTECAACHGPVAERDVLAKEHGTNMAACVACHKAKAAPLECNVCHQLGQ